jgi:hypothetical protein
MLFAGDVVVDGGVGRRWVLGVGCLLFLLKKVNVDGK